MHGRQPDDECRKLLLRLSQLLATGEVSQAARLSYHLIDAYPTAPEAWQYAGRTAQQLGNPTKALIYLDKAIQLEPGNPVWRLQKAHCLLEADRNAEAFELAKSLTGANFPSVKHLASLGDFFVRTSHHALARQCYKTATELEPANSVYHYNLAAVLRFQGDLCAAEGACARAIELNPDDFQAFALRSDLRKQSRDNNHIGEIEARLEQGIESWRGRVQLRFALAKEYEDLGDYMRSFTHLRRGADERRKHMVYDVGRDERTIAKIIDVFSASMFGPAVGEDNQEPIFIIGLPRTGTTLLERILDNHSAIHSAGELNNFAVVMTRLIRQTVQGSIDRDELVKLSARLDLQKLGREYIASTRPGTGGTRFFIDKMPLNFLYAGLIHLALPKARLIHMRRHPLDTCYAIYKHLFRDAYPYSYDLSELGRYYIAYDRLTRHWDEVMPGVIYHVRYEDLVASTESETRAILEHLGLPWQEACMQYFQSESASTTASASQVRRPVYRDSVGKWRHYEAQLAALVAQLDAADIQY